MDSRRGFAWALVAWVVGWGLFCLVKRSAMDLRRGRVSDSGTAMGEVERSLDMVGEFRKNIGGRYKGGGEGGGCFERQQRRLAYVW